MWARISGGRGVVFTGAAFKRFVLTLTVGGDFTGSTTFIVGNPGEPCGNVIER
jgi:hypothetical protein